MNIIPQKPRTITQANPGFTIHHHFHFTIHHHFHHQIHDYMHSNQKKKLFKTQKLISID
jgi:hypothetical protein